MANIIENVFISGYDPTMTYQKYDVVQVATLTYPYYYVSTSGSNSGALNTGTYSSNASWKRFDDKSWGFTDVWTPSYQTTLNTELKPRLSPFGDGYAQKVDSSIFFNKLSYNVAFDVVDNRELKSLVSFFEYKNGKEFFNIDITPFATGRKFIGKNWKHTYIGENVSSFNVNMFEFISDLNA